MSRFGLVEMTRQRRRPSHRLVSASECPYCAGTGVMKTIETLAIESMRAVRAELNKQPVARVEVVAPTDVVIGVLNARAAEIGRLEEEYDCRVQFTGDHLMKQRSFRVQVTPRKRRRGRRGAEDASEPVRPSLLAPLVEQQAEVAAKAREFMKRKPRDLYAEIEAAATAGVPLPAIPEEVVAPVSAPSSSTLAQSPSAPAQSPSAPAQSPSAPTRSPSAPTQQAVRVPPTMWEEAAVLRSLLFQKPAAH